MNDHEIPIGTPVVLYLRNSTDGQINSQADQNAEVQEVVKKRKLKVLKIYTDKGISGSTIAERDGLKQAIQEAAQLGAKAVLVYNISRLTRGGMKHMWKIIFDLEERGVQLYNCQHCKFVDENDLGSAITASLEASQAKANNFDHARDIARTMLANVRDRKNAPGARPPFGFDRLYLDESGKPFQQVRWNPDGTKDVLDPATGNVITTLSKTTPYGKTKSHKVTLAPSTPERVGVATTIFTLAFSMGYKAIAVHLNSLGIPSPRGGKWKMSTIRDILLNPAYGGDIVFNRTTKSRYFTIRDGQPAPRTKKQGELEFKDNPPEQWITIHGGHQALVTPEELNAVKASLALRSRSSIKTGRSPNRSYPLSGILRCGYCGAPMQGICPDGKYRRYICSARRDGGKNQCVPGSLLASKVEELVIGRVRVFMLSDCARDCLRRGLEDIYDAQRRSLGDLDAAQKDMDEFRKKKNDAFAKLMATGSMDFFAAQIEGMKEEEGRLARRLAAVQAALGDTVNKAGFVGQCLELFEHHVLQLKGGCENAIRESLRALGTRVVYHPLNKEGELEIHPFSWSASG